MPPKKLDKFFASKDKKKEKEKKVEAKPEDEEEVIKEVGIEFGITGEFTGRTVKLTKEGTAIETDEALLAPQEAEPSKTWKGKDEAAQEAMEAMRLLVEQKAKEEEANKPQLGVYRPGQGAARRAKDEPMSIAEEQFPALGEATKFKSADDYQKSLQKPSQPATYQPRPSPANAWSSQSAPASNAGASALSSSPSPNAYRPPGAGGGRGTGGGTVYQPPGGGLFKK